MFSTINVGEWSWPTFTVTILLHFRYNLGLYPCVQHTQGMIPLMYLYGALHPSWHVLTISTVIRLFVLLAGNDPPDVPLWCFTSKLTRTHDLNCHQAVRAFPTLRSGYDFGLQCPDQLLSSHLNVHKKTQANLGTPAPSLPFSRKT